MLFLAIGMWGLVGARLVGEGRESTEVARRSAVVLFPIVLLLHTIFVRALVPTLVDANLILAALSVIGGLGFRWVRRATIVLAVIAGSTLFTFIYMFGVAAPAMYLAIIERWELLPWHFLIASISLIGLLVARVRVSLRHQWAKSLDETPGVHIATQDWVLSRETETHGPFLNVASACLGLAFLAALFALRGSRYELLLVMAIAPICLALLLTDSVARIIAFYVAVRRWETAHHVKLQFPRLTRATHRARKHAARSSRGR